MWRRLCDVHQIPNVAPLDTPAVFAGGAVDKKTHLPIALLFPLDSTKDQEVLPFEKKGKKFSFDCFLRWSEYGDMHPDFEPQLLAALRRSASQQCLHYPCTVPVSLYHPSIISVHPMLASCCHASTLLDLIPPNAVLSPDTACERVCLSLSRGSGEM